MKKLFLHNHPDFKIICEAAREETKASMQIVEKDYWVMHVIWSLIQSGYNFELKGGTSLSKGWKIINRFSEDVDIHIHPPDSIKVYSGKNHDKPQHIKSRDEFYDWLTVNTKVKGANSIIRDSAWNDIRFRNCGIKIVYESEFSLEPAIKPHILLEVGFAQVEPNERLTISSWAMNIAQKANLDIVDNRAMGVRCYLPEYTLVEKLEAISKKYQQEQANKILPANFIRHYYDVYQLLKTKRIKDFLGTDEYLAHKKKFFANNLVGNLSSNEAFLLNKAMVRKRYEAEYNNKAVLYYMGRPSFAEILDGIRENLSLL